MSIEDKYYKITAPEKQELISDANLLDILIKDSNPLQKSIDELKAKIQISQTGKQRSILEEQLEELEKLYDLYSKYKKTKLTQKTKQQIEKLFKGISPQISLKQEQIHDDYELIKKILKKEEERLEDTMDIIGYGTIRDLVEENIDILDTRESIPPEEYQDFFDIIAITYINFLEEKQNKKLTKKEENFYLKNKGFYLNENEAREFITKLIKNLDSKYLNLKFKIKLKKENFTYNPRVNLQKWYNDLKENKNQTTAPKPASKPKISKTTERTDNKKESFNQKTIELFNKYFGDNEVINRKSINNLEFTKKLYWAIDRKEINIDDYKKILEYGYYLAFKKEIKSKDGKKGLENIIKNEKNWQQIFLTNLSGTISEKNAKNLFLLSWIESNGLSKGKNKTGAIGYFQILLSTAKKYDKTITEQELQFNPIKSAKISSKYLNDIVKKEVKYAKTDEEKIATALTIYNGNFIKRFKNTYRENFQETLFLLYKELNYIAISKLDKNQKIIKLKNTHNKFMNNNYRGKSHYGILEKTNPSLNSINKWIKNYLNVILKQQTMYPIQFKAFKKVYEEAKKDS